MIIQCFVDTTVSCITQHACEKPAHSVLCTQLFPASRRMLVRNLHSVLCTQLFPALHSMLVRNLHSVLCMQPFPALHSIHATDPQRRSLQSLWLASSLVPFLMEPPMGRSPQVGWLLRIHVGEVTRRRSPAVWSRGCRAKQNVKCASCELRPQDPASKVISSCGLLIILETEFSILSHLYWV